MWYNLIKNKGDKVDINYEKVVSFILENANNKKAMSIVLREVLLNGYYMINVDTNKKRVLLKSKKTKKDFILQERNNGLIIIPDNSNAIGLSENFEEILEIKTNEDNAIVLSIISETNKMSGIYVSTSIWNYEGDNDFTQKVGRYMFFSKDTLMNLNNMQTIDMFIRNSNLRRNGIFNDLYWDMDNLRRNMFIDPKISKRFQINNGYDKEPFDRLYPRWKDRMEKELNPGGLSNIF